MKKLKADTKIKKEDAKEWARTVNDAKSDIDYLVKLISSQENEMGEDFIDENLLEKLKNAKKVYRENHDKWKEAKTEVQSISFKKQQVLKKMVHDFEKWYDLK